MTDRERERQRRKLERTIGKEGWREARRELRPSVCVPAYSKKEGRDRFKLRVF